MTGRRDTLTELVQQQVGVGKRYSVRAFAERAIDPVTGYSPGKSLIGKIIKGLSYSVSPELVAALAVGLDRPMEEVAQAAMRQFIGVVVTDPAHQSGSGYMVRVAHDPGAHLQNMPWTQGFIDSVLGKSDSSDE